MSDAPVKGGMTRPHLPVSLSVTKPMLAADVDVKRFRAIKKGASTAKQEAVPKREAPRTLGSGLGFPSRKERENRNKKRSESS
jgi:hypothetical protein